MGSIDIYYRDQQCACINSSTSSIRYYEEITAQSNLTQPNDIGKCSCLMIHYAVYFYKQFHFPPVDPRTNTYKTQHLFRWLISRRRRRELRAKGGRRIRKSSSPGPRLMSKESADCAEIPFMPEEESLLAATGPELDSIG